MAQDYLQAPDHKSLSLSLYMYDVVALMVHRKLQPLRCMTVF